MSLHHSDEEFIEAVRMYEPAATTKVAQEVGVAQQSADRRLRQLLEDGQVDVEMIGNSLAWSVPPED